MVDTKDTQDVLNHWGTLKLIKEMFNIIFIILVILMNGNINIKETLLYIYIIIVDRIIYR